MDLFQTARSLLYRTLGAAIDLAHAPQGVEEAKILAAQLLLNQQRTLPPNSPIRAAEFKVFSQYGDDGIIQFLVRHAQRVPDAFVEFGVEDYRESNTRFLLVHDNWRGLVMDASAGNVRRIRSSRLSWRNELTAIRAFITRENINQLLATNGFDGPIGLLSIDVDGNDYWIWEAIEVAQPVIVVVEYNSVFGSKLAVAVPYDSGFQRNKAHYSNLYWGASLSAFVHLGRRKGYAFLGCNSAGNNAYFVKNEHLGELRPVEPVEGFVASRFRESRDRRGALSYVSGEARARLIEGLPLLDVISGEPVRLRDL